MMSTTAVSAEPQSSIENGARSKVALNSVAQSSPKNGRLKGRIALVDAFCMRQECTVALLSAHLRARTVGFAELGELLEELNDYTECPGAVIFSVGPASITDPPFPSLIKRLVEVLGPSPVIWLSDQEDLAELVAAFQVGIRGYIPTSMEPKVIIQAIRMVLSGGAFFPATPRARAQLALRREKVDCRPAATESDALGERAEAPAPARPEVADQLRHWPRRQLTVLALIVAGKANKEIAETLEMDESTVKSHMRQIMRKLGVTNRTQVALCGRKLGVIPAD